MKETMPDILPITYHANGTDLFSRFWDLPYACWLDSGKPRSHYGRYDIISALPATRLVTREQTTDIYYHRYDDHGFSEDVDKIQQASTIDPFQLLQTELDKLTQMNICQLPFSGGAIGYFAYELGQHYIKLNNLRHIKRTQSGFAAMQVGIYHWAIIQDHLLKKAWFVSLPECASSILEEVKQRLAESHTPKQEQALSVDALKSKITRDQYIEQLKHIDDYILAGDCYQINFAQCFQGNYTGDPYSAYKQLRQIMASPFSAYLQLDKQAIMSLSPERFVQVENGRVLTQPIKGTIPRHAQTHKDEEQAQHLLNDAKNRSENVMIVDLLRNDLCRHCLHGSIKVDELFGLQSFPNVHHLVSTVSGVLNKDSTSLHLFRDSFPGGSITGAPKKRAMEIIHELEPHERGVYCGSIGYINNNGDMDTNIAIRTVSCDGKQLYCWGGGGIVADSQAGDEYLESLAKINKILETLRVNQS